MLPNNTPLAPIISPSREKIWAMLLGAAPIAFKMPISRLRSFTDMVSMLMMLNPATITIRLKTTKLAHFCNQIHAYRLPWAYIHDVGNRSEYVAANVSRNSTLTRSGFIRIDEAHLNAGCQVAPLQVPLCSREGYVD